MSHTNGAAHADRPAEVAAGRWVLDPAHSSVRFASKAFWGLLTVRGEFGSVSGQGEVLPDGGARGTLTVRTDSLDTKNAKRDTHLRSDDFFASDEHPELVFNVRTAAAGADGTVEVAGDLAVRGITRPLAFTARATPAGDSEITLTAELPISRADFGMTWNQLGMLKDPAEISVTARFIHQG